MKKVPNQLEKNTRPVSAAVSAPVQEVFSSIQGEGIHIGQRQVFVRFAHCHLKCAYCDTPMSSPTGRCHVETRPGSGQTEQIENPLTPDSLRTIIESLLAQGHFTQSAGAAVVTP